MGAFALVVMLAMAFSPIEGYNWDFPWYAWVLAIFLALADKGYKTIIKNK